MVSSSDRVSICIPTWEAEAFIGDAIECAQQQTHRDLDILISVDQSADATLDICHRYAGQDSRIRVYEHAQRLGWTGNVNFLLDQVATDFYAIYFHDDKVSEQWIATLLDMLNRRPDAGSAYCRILSNDAPNSGQPHDGDVFERLMTRLAGTPKGSPLRALTRRSAQAAPVRFPEVSMLGYNAQHAYLVDLVAAAPLLYTSETLYFRWNRREGGVTDKWSAMDPALVASDLAETAAAIARTINACIASAGERDILHYAAGLLLRETVTRGHILDKTPLEQRLDDFLPLPPRARVHDAIRRVCPAFEENILRMEATLGVAPTRAA